MNTKSRIASILKTHSLESSITGFPTFDLSDLELDSYLEFQIPTNVRLGHIAEKIVSELIQSSANYNVLFENIQVIENKTTVGEIDFIIQKVKTNQIIHLELAYKFYLFDPSISSEFLGNWIGPNRNDSLKQKLEKLKSKQFPLLHHSSSQAAFGNLEIDKASQVLCLLASLFIPYQYKGRFDPSYKKAIKGYYLNFEALAGMNHSAKSYCIPAKKEWGMNPSENEIWKDFAEVESGISKSISEKQAPLCWLKHNDSYSSFFIVWW